MVEKQVLAAGLGRVLSLAKGFASPAACLDGSQNTALKEDHLLDSLEKVSFHRITKC